MQNCTTRLRSATVLTIVAGLLSLSMLSIASANQTAEQTRVATVHPKKHVAGTSWQSGTERRELYRSAPAGCTWPYQNQFPPCMSTWPAGDPHYHGSRPGPTFNDE
jgi:hypothetical protein